jgi:hypothetical protein
MTIIKARTRFAWAGLGVLILAGIGAGSPGQEQAAAKLPAGLTGLLGPFELDAPRSPGIL